MASATIALRLTCSLFWVDVRLRKVQESWLASADTPDGPTIGCGDTPLDALTHSLDEFYDVRAELLGSLESGALDRMRSDG